MTQHSDIKQALDYAIGLHSSGKVERALFVYQEIAVLYPGSADLLLNIGSALHDLERYSEALKLYDVALKINPNWWQAYYNMGNSLLELDRYYEAIECYERCIAINPDHVEAFATKGTALEALGLYAEALIEYDNAISRKQDCAEAHWNRGLALLRQGAFIEGWREYEWRCLKKGYTTKQRSWDCPKWDGRELAGEKILIHAEQAFGDTLQFIRYAPIVTARGGEVIVECPEPLVALLSKVEGVRHIIPSGTKCHADYHVPLLSLPMIFGTTLETIPSKVPYLIAPPERIQYWSSRISSDGKLRAGVAWAGRKTPDPHRTCGLEALYPLAGLKGITYYSLQIGMACDIVNAQDAGLELLDYTGEINDFADTAALIENLDLVITIDTSVAHLAGALGKKTLIMVPYAPDWRWMLGRRDSPWYPTMRIFRQQRPNEWSGVVSQVIAELAKLTGNSDY